MKTKLLLLSFFLISAVISTKAQSKKEIEENLSKCTVTRDSIQKELSGLSTKHDSLYKQYIAYDSMYQVVKEKVFQYKFNPSRTSELIDSLRASRNQSLSGQKDSLSILTAENTSMKAKLDSLTNDEAVKVKVVNDLKQLKDLLDAKIITQSEFDTKKAILIQKF